jgi:hypothetical protein
MNTRRKPRFDLPCGRFGFSMIVLWAATALLASPPVLAGSERCIEAKVSESVRMPHGESVGPGTLRLCGEKLSPVSHLHHTVLNGHPVAVLLSNTSRTESVKSGDPAIVLHRIEDGSLLLAGYILPSKSGGTAHWFVRYGRGVKANVRVSEPQILIAATLD